MSSRDNNGLVDTDDSDEGLQLFYVLQKENGYNMETICQEN